MILVTVGNDLPFSRLLKQADAWSKDHPDERVLAQTGRLRPADYVPRFMEAVELLAPEAFERTCGEAKLLVAHAGMGSIITALSTGKKIVILPRIARLGEHRNDHQLTTAKRFSGRPGLFVAWTEAELPEAMDRALTAPATSTADRLPKFAPPDFINKLRNKILHNRPPTE